MDWNAADSKAVESVGKASDFEMFAIFVAISGIIGIKFVVQTRDVWSMEGNVRYQYSHAVSAVFPPGVHRPTCLDC